MKDIRKEIKEWADMNMEIDPTFTVYPLWQKVWRVRDAHLLLRLTLFGDDGSADIIIGSCSASYGGNEEYWDNVYLGRAHSLEQIAAIYKWLENKANTIQEKTKKVEQS